MNTKISLMDSSSINNTLNPKLRLVKEFYRK